VKRKLEGKKNKRAFKLKRMDMEENLDEMKTK